MNPAPPTRQLRCDPAELPSAVRRREDHHQCYVKLAPRGRYRLFAINAIGAVFVAKWLERASTNTKLVAHALGSGHGRHDLSMSFVTISVAADPRAEHVLHDTGRENCLRLMPNRQANRLISNRLGTMSRK